MTFTMSAVVFFTIPWVLIGVYIIIFQRSHDRRMLDPELRYKLEGELIAFRRHTGGGEYASFEDLQDNGPKRYPVVKICVNGKFFTREVLLSAAELSKEDVGKMIPLISVGKKKKGKGLLYIDNAEHRAKLNRSEDECRKMKISRVGIGFIVLGIMSGLWMSITLGN